MTPTSNPSTTTVRRSHTTIDSPIGPLTLVADGGTLCGLHMDGQRHRPHDGSFGRRDAGPFAEAVDQLDEYFAGRRTTFEVDMAPAGTDFQQQVWGTLRDIPYGATASYGQIASRVGRPRAVRAVGLANGRNPIAIMIPCHRVVGASGDLVGYGGGLDRKRQLLELERRCVPAG